MALGKGGIHKGRDLCDHGKAVGLEVGQNRVNRCHVCVGARRVLDARGVVKAAAAAFEVDHHRAGALERLERIKNLLGIVKHVQINIVAADIRGAGTAGAGITIDDLCIRQGFRRARFARRRHVGGSRAAKIQIDPVCGIDHKALEIDRQQDQQQQKDCGKDQPDLKALLQLALGAVG